MKPKTLCSNCGKPIGKIGVMSPTIDEMRRQQCVECADKWLKPGPLRVIKAKLGQSKLVNDGKGFNKPHQEAGI